MHPIDRTHGRGLAARQLPLDSGVYPPKRDPGVPGNQLDDCGVCVLLPTVSGKGVRATQVGCPVHGEPRRDSRRCPARYERPGGREIGDRIVSCHLPAGHRGEHEEADTEVTWVDGAEPLERSDLPEGQQSKELIEIGRLFLSSGAQRFPGSWTVHDESAAILVARVRAAVAEEIAQAIELAEGERCPECRGKPASLKWQRNVPGIRGVARIGRCGAGHVWHHAAKDWRDPVAIAREHAVAPAERSVGSPTSEVGTPDPRADWIRDWDHEDGSPCYAGYMMPTPAAATGAKWWCTEHQQHLRPAVPSLPETQEGDTE